MENQNFNEKVSFMSKVKNILLKIKSAFGTFWKEIFVFPGYILSHPVAGWQEFKQEKKGKIGSAITIILLYILMKMVEYKNLGPVVNVNNPHNFNSVMILIYGLVPPILLSVANWSVTTLMDGKGKMKEIFMMICYCLYPFIWANAAGMILSNVLTQDEMALYTLVIGIGVVLALYMFFFGIISIHEYGLGRCLLTILFTLVAALVILFACLLFFDLFQRMYGFVYIIYREITLRELLW